MISINEIRQKYPQYNSLSDDDLADKLHAKYYSQLSKKDFNNRIGLNKSSENIDEQKSGISDIPGYALKAAINFPVNLWNTAKEIPGAYSKIRNDPWNALRDITGGTANIVQNIGASGLELGELITRKLAERLGQKLGNPVTIPKWNAREAAGLGENYPVSLGKIIASKDPDPLLYNFIPQLFSASSLGTKTIPFLTGSALSAASQAKPGERIKAATEGVVNAGIPLGLVKAYSRIKGTTKPVENEMTAPNYASPLNDIGNVQWGASPNEFGNLNIGNMDFLNPEKSQVLSENIANEIKNQMSGGKNIEETGKQLARHIHETYKSIKENLQNRYNHLFESPTEHESIFTGEPFKLKEMRIDNGEYTTNFKDEKIPDSNIMKLHEKYVENPTIGNAHPLQSELGSEIGYLQKQLADKKLDSTGKNLLKKYKEMRDILKNDMRDEMDNINPEFSKEYENLTREWKSEINPWHSDKNLKNIAEGKIKNPTISEIKNIFKNPEENINKITSLIGEKGQNAISYIGMGKTLNHLTPEGLMAGKENLEKSGLSSYLTPMHDQLMTALEKNIAHGNEIQKSNNLHEKILSQLEKARKDAESARIKISKQRESNNKKAVKESESRYQEHKKRINELQDELKKQEESHKNKVKNLIKTGVGSLLGAKLGARFGGVEGEVVGGIVGSKLGKKGKDVLK